MLQRRLALQRRMPPTTPCKWDSQPRLPWIVSRRPISHHSCLELETPANSLKINNVPRRVFGPGSMLRHEVHVPTAVIKIRNC